ncbi:unnamed protein product [Ascophyllum nodosum]
MESGGRSTAQGSADIRVTPLKRKLPPVSSGDNDDVYSLNSEDGGDEVDLQQTSAADKRVVGHPTPAEDTRRRRKRSKNAITTAGDAIAQGKIPNIEAEAWKSFVESLMCDDNEDTRTLLARNMSVNENVRKEAYGFATAYVFAPEQTAPGGILFL